MKRPLLIHPWLFALYPTLFVYAHNIQEVSLREVWLPALVSLAGAALVALLAWPAFKTREKVGLVVTLAVIYVFAYGYAADGLTDVGLWLRPRWLLSVWTALLLCGLYLTWRTRRCLAATTKLLNVMAACLTAMCALSIAASALQARRPRRAATGPSAEAHPGAAQPAQGPLPDIYYIIVDRYARADVLEAAYGFDNSEFLDYLTAKGFYVAPDSYANYPTTDTSLASSLNMVHLRGQAGDGSDDLVDRRQTYPLLQRHALWMVLKRQGYRFVHFGGWWEPTARNRFADQNVNLGMGSELLDVIYSRTVLSPILSRIGLYNWRASLRNRVLYAFERIREIPAQGGPTFAFVHFLCPHPPYVFAADGSYLPETDSRGLNLRELYALQVAFLNDRLKGLIEHIIQESPVLPIIVLQADEGPYTPGFQQDAFCDCSGLSDEELWQKMAILNAYYLPGFPREKLYPGITPVNSFRLIFNHYFGTNYPLLPDDSYGWTGRGAGLRYLNITERLRKFSARAAGEPKTNQGN